MALGRGGRLGRRVPRVSIPGTGCEEWAGVGSHRENWQGGQSRAPGLDLEKCLCSGEWFSILAARCSHLQALKLLMPGSTSRYSDFTDPEGRQDIRHFKAPR